MADLRTDERTRLHNLEVNEVSLVPRAANQKKFLLFKSREGKTMDEAIETILQTAIEKEDVLGEWIEKQKLSDKAQNALRGASRLMSAFRDELPDDAMQKIAEMTGYDASVQKTKHDPEEDERKRREEEEKKKRSQKTLHRDNEGEDGKMKNKTLSKEDISAMPEEVRKAVETLQGQSENLQKAHDAAVQKSEEFASALKIERNARLLKEHVERAETDYADLPSMSAADLGALMKNLAEKAPDEAAKIAELLKSTSEVVAKSAMFDELGRNIAKTGANDAWTAIQAKANEYMAKGDFKSEAQAIDKVLKLHPDMYQRYLNDSTN